MTLKVPLRETPAAPRALASGFPLCRRDGVTEDALRRAGSAWTGSRCWLEVNFLALPEDSATHCAQRAAVGSIVGENSPSWVGSRRGPSRRIDGLRVGSNAEPLQLGRGG